MLRKLKFEERSVNEKLSRILLYREKGKVTKSIGLTFEGFLPGANIGSIVRIIPAGQNNVTEKIAKESLEQVVDAEVVGFKDKKVILMPLDEVHGVSSSNRITLMRSTAEIPVGDWLLGRVIDGKGEPIDGKGPLIPDDKVVRSTLIEKRSIYGTTVNPLSRMAITEPLDLGVKALNGFLTCGKGQRMGIMAGSGVGKSVLLGMMARYTNANINVIALIGERGREVNEFIEQDLGEEGLKRSVVVVSTSDKSPLLRMRGAFIATTIAEYFCDAGKDVLLMMDSVTRFAMAQREIGLSMGEPPASKGYTPSVFSVLPKLLERAGRRASSGSITGLYTVLVEGDDMDEPIADATRATLDGHVVLSRMLASRNQYPAIDVSQSVSRVMRSIISKKHRELAGQLKELMSVYQTNEDLVNIGAYVKGTNTKLDQALSVIDRIKNFLKQEIEEKCNLENAVAQMESILAAVSTK